MRGQQRPEIDRGCPPCRRPARRSAKRIPAHRVSCIGLLLLALAGCDPPAGSSEPVVDGEWLAEVEASMDRGRYQVRSADGGELRFVNPAQGLEARLDGTAGITVTSRRGSEVLDATGGAQVTLQTVAWGRASALRQAGQVAATTGGCATPQTMDERGRCLRRAELNRPGHTEWWSNDARGIQQGWTVAEPPQGDGPLVFEVEAEGADWLHDGGSALLLAEGGGRLRYGEPTAWDSEERELPARLERVDAQHLRVLVEVDGARWPVTVDPLITTAAWSADGAQADAGYGYAVAQAGDLNGDGYRDVVVGAPWFDDGEDAEGGVFVHFGSASGLEDPASWSAHADQADANMGKSVAGAGDVNGDGYDDLLVGTPQWIDAVGVSGRAQLWLGSASGLAATADWSWSPGYQHGKAGTAVAGAGDLNGDGYADVAVGMPGWGNGRGQVHAWLGSASGLAASPDWSWSGSAVGQSPGETVAAAGDVDGDGYDDLLVGAPYADWSSSNTNENRGKVYLFSGSAAGPGGPTWFEWGDHALTLLGTGLAGAGDINGDGYADIAIGSPYDNTWASGGGKIQVWHGSPSGLAYNEDWTWFGTTNNSRWGWNLHGPGDINGDGWADLAVFIHGYRTVTVFAGSSSGLAANPTLGSVSDTWTSEFGQAFSGAGDVDGDGWQELLVGAFGDDRVYLYPSAASLPAVSPSWTAQPDQAGAALATSVAAAGDVNGDGYTDLLVGAPDWDGGEAGEGAAFLYLGGPGGPAATAAWSVESDQVNAALGSAVAGAADLDGDGYADLAIGVPGWDATNPDEGQVRVYLGSPSGPGAVEAWSAAGGQPGAHLGSSLASAADVDGDGYTDLLAGAELWDGGSFDEGGAFLWLGSASGLPATPSWSAEGGQAGAHFGAAVDGVGDLDGDGWADLAVGAPDWNGGQSAEGQVRVWLGSASGPGEAADWSIESDEAFARLGAAVAGAGDLDGDGHADLVLGCPACDDGEADEGTAQVFYGSASGLAGTADWTGQMDQADAGLGDAVATAGDLNGDGYADLVVGAPDWSTGNTGEGAAFVWLGSASGLATGEADWTRDGNLDDAALGASVAGVGDLDGDGLGDLALGAPGWTDGQTGEGSVRIHLGGAAAGVSPRQFTPRAFQPSTATPLPPGGRSYSDGFDVELFAHSPWGRDQVALQVEVQPLGTPFDGTGLVQGPWTDTGLTGVTLTQAITGLALETAWHWRARVVYEPGMPLTQPGSRWLFGGVSGDSLGVHLRTACLADQDGDGRCDSFDPDIDGDGFDATVDCDDTDPALNPGAVELCDAEDTDCDGSLVDEFDDTDGDSDPDCTDPDDDDDGEADGGDCAPLEASIFPGATELCDGIDSDCDGSLVDDFEDTDGDLDPDCIDLDDDDDGVDDDGDCGPLDASAFPGAPESCDGIDSDCDGSLVDDFDDTDGDLDPDCHDPDDDDDGYVDVSDCAPLDASIHPAAAELCDGTDSDCDGSLVDAFDDTDGDLDPDCTDLDDDDDGALDGGDCAPLDGGVYPGAVELCDAIDADCDGSIVDEFDDFDGDLDPDCLDLDDDGDAFPDLLDCGPLDADVYPNAPELCDDTDSDCDGSKVDEYLDLNTNGLPDCIDPDADGDGAPDDVDCNDADPAIYPGAPELPGDGIDQDCNGADTALCWTDIDQDGVGVGESFVDADGSCSPAAPTDGDCDDGDPLNFPGNPEVCDGLDNDCSGAADADPDGELDADGDGHRSCNDCDDDDPDNAPGATEVCDGQDNDCSGGADADPDGEVDHDEDGALSCADCDDADPLNFDGNVELCDGRDNDCSGDADADPGGEADTDADGVLSCADCDDTDPLSYPGFVAVELCDGADNDCSGGLDPAEADVDDDGWLLCVGFFDRGLGLLGGGDCDDFDSGAWPGAAEASTDTEDRNCDGVFGQDVDGDGYALEDGDCDDGDSSAYPGAPEACDGKDSDCDGVLTPEELVDADGDGVRACEDCADGVADISPLATEFCDGRDSDCDGLMPTDEVDSDDDGVPPCAGDCDDDDPDVGPDQPEVCDNGLDDDCDGSVDVDEDADGDGWGTCEGDCDDLDPEVHPDAAEQCNGLDDDCDGVIDPAFDGDGDGWTACPDRDGQPGDCDDGDPTVHPFAEAICDDGVDNDCDPATFETLDTDGDGWAACEPGEPVGDCWEGNPLVFPGAAELCDWVDNDCDGQTDEYLDVDEDGQVPCEGDCEEGVASAFTGGVEVCDDGLDGDCDGEIDEDCLDPSAVPDPALSPPGCMVECGVGSTPGPAGLTLLGLALVGLGWTRRRRDRRRIGPAVAALLLLPSLASAQTRSPEDVAMAAYAFQQEYCADVAGTASTTAVSAALTQVTTVLTPLSEVYDETGKSFLLYWRGVLLQCVQFEERASSDLRAFVSDPATQTLYSSLHKDAERRLRTIQRKLEGSGPTAQPAPILTVGVGGGYQLTAEPQQPFHYGYAGLDVSIKLVGPLRLVVFGRPAISGPVRLESGLAAEPRQHAVLVAFGVGPALRWEGPVRPGIELRFQLAPNNSPFSEAKLLAGALVSGGVGIGLGRSPLALRPVAEVGFLGRMFLVRGGLQLVASFGAPGTAR